MIKQAQWIEAQVDIQISKRWVLEVHKMLTFLRFSGDKIDNFSVKEMSLDKALPTNVQSIFLETKSK